MKTVLPLIACIGLLASVCVAADDRESVLQHVRVMTSATEPWEDRCAAEDALQTFPAKLVLPALVPHVSQGMPSQIIWNSGGRELDKRASVEWQVFYAVHRSWNHYVISRRSAELGELMLGLLPKIKTDTGRRRILESLAIHWTPKAEEDLSRLLDDQGMNYSIRAKAGLCLMLHGEKNYHEAFLEFAKSANGKEREAWFDLLVDPRHRRKTGIDPYVVAFGFDMLHEERKARPDYIGGAYSIACDLSRYLAEPFQPSVNDDKYQAQHGLNEAFFVETVENALDWWEERKPADPNQDVRGKAFEGVAEFVRHLKPKTPEGWKLLDPKYSVRPYGWEKGRGCHILVYHQKAPVVAGKRAPWTDLHVWIMDVDYQVEAATLDDSSRPATEIARWRQRRVFFLGDGEHWPTNKSDVLAALKASDNVAFDAAISTEQLRESLKASKEELRRRKTGEGPRWTIPTDLLRKRVEKYEATLQARETANTRPAPQPKQSRPGARSASAADR